MARDDRVEEPLGEGGKARHTCSLSRRVRFRALIFSQYDGVPARRSASRTGRSAIASSWPLARGFRASTRRRIPLRSAMPSLAGYDVVIWLSTSGDVLDGRPAGRLRAVHPRRPRLRGHPPRRQAPSTTGPGTADSSAPISATTRASSTRSSRSRRSTSRTAAARPRACCRRAWTREDELVQTSPPSRRNVHVLLELDENTYEGEQGTAGRPPPRGDHPIAWCSGATTAGATSTPRSATRAATGPSRRLPGPHPRRDRDGRRAVRRSARGRETPSRGSGHQPGTGSGRRPRAGPGR